MKTIAMIAFFAMSAMMMFSSSLTAQGPEKAANDSGMESSASEGATEEIDRDPAAARNRREEARKKLQADFALAEKKMRSGLMRESLPVLSLAQTKNLSYWNRVRYVSLVRQLFATLSEFERTFGYDVAAAPKNLQEEIFAWLVASDLFAQSTGRPRQHNRNFGPARDYCIYAFHLQTYVSGRQDFGCEMPMDGRCRHPQHGNGLSCSFIGSGLSGEDACFPMGQALTSTQWCMRQIERLRGERVDDINRILNGYQAFVASKGGNLGSVTTQEMDEWAERLANIAFDERAMAHMVTLAELNRNNGGRSRDRNLQRISSEFDKNVGLADRVMGLYLDHCSRTLGPDAIASIERNAAQSGNSYNIQQERERLRRLRAVGRENATVGNVLQAPECEVVITRHARLRDAMAEVNRTLPTEVPPPTSERLGVTYDENGRPNGVILRHGANRGGGAAEPDLGDANRPAQPGPAIPGGATQAGTNICGGNRPDTGDSYLHGLVHQDSFRCLVCAAETDVMTANDPNIHPSGYANRGVSRRWMALLGIMTRACGDAGAGPVSMQTALDYMQTFGHCSAEMYEWDRGSFREGDEAKLRQWQEGQNLGSADRGRGWFDTGDFKRLFGEDLRTMRRYFCDKSAAESRFTTGSRRYWAQRRFSAKEQFDKANYFRHVNQDEIRRNPEATPFNRCFEKSFDTANALYSGSRLCRGLAGGEAPRAVGAHDRPVLAQAGGNQCLVSHSVVRADGQNHLHFESPGRQGGEGNLHLGNGNFRGSPAPTSFSAFGSQYCPDSSGREGYYVPASSGVIR